MARCRNCGVEAPPPDELEAAGWGDGGSLCPVCRAERNARARANAGAIAAGLAREFAQGFGPGSAVVTVRTLPAMAVRSTWALGSAGAMVPNDAADLWRELGDGYYLMTAQRGGRTEHLAVTVEDGIAREAEPVDEAELPTLIRLAGALEEETTAGPAEVVVAVDPEVRVELRDVTPARHLLS